MNSSKHVFKKCKQIIFLTFSKADYNYGLMNPAIISNINFTHRYSFKSPVFSATAAMRLAVAAS